MHESWDRTPRTYFRPFTSFTFFHPQVLEVLKELEAKWGRQSSNDTLDVIQTPGSIISELGEDETMAQVADSLAALTELRCYVKFVEGKILPQSSQFDKLDENTKPARVLFQDLWYLFRPGELIYRPVGSNTTSDRDNADPVLGQRLWRVHGIRPFWPRYQDTLLNNFLTSEEDDKRVSFAVHCYHIDYTGEEYCIVPETFEIQPYDGERSIHLLKFFPVRFFKNHKAILEDAKHHGRRFIHFTAARHAAYDWWTTIRDPRGEPTTDVDGNILTNSEFINSEVIVDFVEAFKAQPQWKPKPSVLRLQEPTSATLVDEVGINWWSDTGKSRLIAETDEIIPVCGPVLTLQYNGNLVTDKLLVKVRQNDRNDKLTGVECLEEEDLVLLPLRMFAYVLRDRKFVQVDVMRLHNVKESRDAFDGLKIPDDHKHMIRSVVDDHFKLKGLEKQDGAERTSLDLIKGKGKGLFILLYGVPGVGKTATAEAVAQENGKPLFPITCGDLGLTPGEVETALGRIFRLADTWDCVLLLDEVDTFFPQRVRGDASLAKNALVSVLLRVLDNYDGLLFLTTNRPGALDEAFISRIHLNLHYGQLNWHQTEGIWQMTIDRLRQVENERCQSEAEAGDPQLELMQIDEQEIMHFARERFHQHRGKFRWNGRQIRNAFQIASSLAHYDARKRQTRPRLTVGHFKMIHSVTDDFDEFMQETVGKDASGMAFARGDRADHWRRKYAGEENGGQHEPELPPNPRSPRLLDLSPFQFGRRPLTNGPRPTSPRDESFEPRTSRDASPNSSLRRPHPGSRPPSFSLNGRPKPPSRAGDRSFNGDTSEHGNNTSNGAAPTDDYDDGLEFPEYSLSGGRKRGYEERLEPDHPGPKRRRESEVDDYSYS